jgi:DNA-binding CsgD family transcriptional regulator
MSCSDVETKQKIDTKQIFMTNTLMTKNNIAILPSPAPTRSCARCGERFPAFGREYSCPACRKPTAAVPEPAKQAALSFREQQIVALIQQAKTNKEIAYELCLAEGTVKEYLYRIFRKMAVTNRTELALRSARELFSLNAEVPAEQRCFEPTG